MKDRQDHGFKILAALRSSGRPLKRRELADICGPHNCKISTAEREIRATIDWLVLQGHPVYSDGTGFRIAGNAAEWEAAIRIREKALRTEALKLRRLRRLLKDMTYSPTSHQPDLFGGSR